MADFPAAVVLPAPPTPSLGLLDGWQAIEVFKPGGDPGVIVYFKMRGEDSGESPGTPNRYVFWVVVGAQDFAGTGFASGKHPDGSLPTGSFVASSAVQVAAF